MPIYLFFVLATPKAVIKQIQNIQRTFIWGGTEGHRKWDLVDWKTLCKLKEAGGLGIRDPTNINRVLEEKFSGNGSPTLRDHGRICGIQNMCHIG